VSECVYSADSSFFRYCQMNCAISPSHKEPVLPPRPAPKVDGEEEVISDYSWRNFFTCINFLKVVQKMTKHRTHRILLLVQYKSSVGVGSEGN
jgi:hypothetical protein